MTSISETLEAEHREARASVPNHDNAPPPEKRFGLRRLSDGELVAHGAPAALRKLQATLGGNMHRLVRLAKPQGRTRTSVPVSA